MKTKFPMKMKLSKGVCKQCWKRKGWSWIHFNEDWKWERGEVNCVYGKERDGDYLLTQFIDKIPENCPYRLEHLVTGNRDETKAQ